MTKRKNLTPDEENEYVRYNRERASEWQRQNPERAKQRKQEWYLQNRDLCLAREKERKAKTRKPKEVLTSEQREERRKQYMREYYTANKETIVNRWIKAKREYMKDPLFRIKEAIRSRVNAAITRRGYTKKSRTFQIIGCSFEEFAHHIESQFVDGMTWDNKDEWHIDHKVPVSIAQNEEELIKLNHYTNLRPLYAKDNFSKGDTMLEEFIPLRVNLLGW